MLRQSKAGVLHQKNKLDQNNKAKAQKTKVSLKLEPTEADQNLCAKPKHGDGMPK